MVLAFMFVWSLPLAYICFTFALKAIHITLSRAFKPQFTRESRVTHARGLSTRCEHKVLKVLKHNDCYTPPCNGHNVQTLV